MSACQRERGVAVVLAFAETVVDIYGSQKVKINNAVSQVEVPLAKSQAFFSRQGK